MKRLSIPFFLLLVLFLPRPTVAAILFTEVAWMGTASSQFSEWVELFNDGTAEVDLAGFVLVEGTSTPIFTLTKKISPGGYYLVERTTASSPDAIPGINDDAGSWGGGGLSNGGETLVLKDSGGQVVATLDASLGWPAGDASEKLTMQWTGSLWVTATATPRSATTAIASPPPSVSGGGSSSSTSSGSGGGSSSPSSASTHSSPVALSTVQIDKPSLAADAGRNRSVLVGAPLQFIGKAKRGDDSLADPQYSWSFGDGSLVVGETPEHVYEYPGTYHVVLNVREGADQAVARTVVKVEDAQIVLGRVNVDESSVEIVNRLSSEANLGNFILDAGGQTFRIPKDTIIGAGQKLVFGRRVTNFTLDPSASVRILRPDDRVVDAYVPSLGVSTSSSLFVGSTTAATILEIQTKLSAARAELARRTAPVTPRAATAKRPLEKKSIPATVESPAMEEIVVRVPPTDTTVASFVGFWKRIFGSDK